MAEKIKEGEWVVNDVTGNMGYVLEIMDTGQFHVQYTMHRGGVQMGYPFKNREASYKLSPMPPEPRIYHKDEMDLALSTKDIAWCEELQKLKGEKIDG